MDSTRSIDDNDVDRDYPSADEPTMEAPPSIGSDERRMHVRAYNYWVSLLDGRAYPAMADLDPATVPDFGPHGVVLDFSAGSHDPAIPFVGTALRDEGGHDQPIEHVSDVPRGSLLSRLTDHIDEIIANHAPIGFEAEFVNQRGRAMMYRGILMPFSTDQAEIDAIYGVINWKEAPPEDEARALSAEVAASLARAPAPVATPSPVWADGPNAAPLMPSPFPLADDFLSGLHDPVLDDAMLDDAMLDGPAAGRFAPADEAPLPGAAGFNRIDATGDSRRALRRRAPLATIDEIAIAADPAQPDEFVLLVGRRSGDGRIAILSTVDDARLLDRALDRLAG